MAPEKWLEQIARRMLVAGLPLHYVKRTTLELSDHLWDSHQSTQSPSQVLGVAPKQLVAQFTESYRCAKWYRRIPSVALCAFSIPLCISVCLIFHFSVLLLLEAFLGVMSPTTEPWNPEFVFWFYYSGKLITPVIAIYILLRLLDAGGKLGWARHCSIGLLCFMFFVTMTDFQIATAREHATFSLLVETEALSGLWILLWQLAQVSMVLIVVAIENYRQRDQERDLFGSLAVQAQRT